MSLLQFLQQTLIKDVSHQLLQQIQSQHEAVQNMLDNLSSLRSLDKYSIIQSKINDVKSYLNLKQSIYRSLTGLEGAQFQQWIKEIFHDSILVLQLVKMQRTKIEKMIIKTLREVFIVQMPNSNSQAQEQEKLNYYLLKLNKLKDNQISKTSSTRQQVLQASRLDLIFQQYKQKMQQKIYRFNRIIQNYVFEVKSYSQKIKLQFGNMLRKQPQQNQTYEPQTPFKQIKDYHQMQQYQPSNQDYMNSAKVSRNSFRNPHKYSYQSYMNPQNSKFQLNRWRDIPPTRDIYYFETI